MLLRAICLSVRACVFACRPLMNLNDVRESAAAEQHFLFVTRWLAAAYMLAGSVSNDGRAAEQPGFLRIRGVEEPPPLPPLTGPARRAQLICRIYRISIADRQQEWQRSTGFRRKQPAVFSLSRPLHHSSLALG